MTDVGVEDANQAESSVGTLAELMTGNQLPKWFWRAILGIAFSVAAFMVVTGSLAKLEG